MCSGFSTKEVLCLPLSSSGNVFMVGAMMDKVSTVTAATAATSAPLPPLVSARFESGAKCDPSFGVSGAKCDPFGVSGAKCDPSFGVSGVKCDPFGVSGVKCDPFGVSGAKCDQLSAVISPSCNSSVLFIILTHAHTHL